ncbi:ATP-binding protein [Rhodoferax sp.]|uniref:hybrid sensor histidine kinase/response regulator n=1 Tax=Rhodoferax sp. TaxID=50421 RepID=UPI0025F71793|nr:ATP-binding protein [Rhodoferax sp.]
MSLEPLNATQLMHDLQVHQIELQLQNEELRRAQVALELSHARYFDLYDMAPVGYLTVAADGLITEANLCAAGLLGVVRSALVKRPLSRFIVKAHQDNYYRCRRQLLETGQAQSCELQMLQNDGVALWVRLVVSAVQPDSAETDLRLVIADISERRNLFDALQKTNQTLELARKQADKANLAKSEFLSSMSHELRSPLNAILGFAQLLEIGKPAPTPTQQASLEQIIKGGWYLLSLINEILDLATIESGHAVLTMNAVEVGAVLQDCQAMIEPLAAARAVRISFPQPPVTFSAQADPIRLKQVIINLLSNAIKYNREGGSVEVCCSTPTAGRLRISVRDSGMGLSAQQLGQLFQPFNRLGQEGGRNTGTGIGLVVSQQLVRSMGAEMRVRSTVGVGSEFWFDLAVSEALPASPAPALAPVPEAAPPARSGALRSVLYVEDGLVNLALVEQLLAERSDLHFLGAQDAMRGIEMARSLQPDVIVMDIHLPGINGFDALKILRSDTATAHIPVLALSANAMPRDVDKGLIAGFYRYITKPIKVDEFLQALDEGLAMGVKAQ